MSSKLRNNKNEKTTTARERDLDKQDPLDFETLNSEPKGKTKSKQTRLRDRQEREKLLQQHRLHQQESLKRQRERENIQKQHLTTEHHEPNQHTQIEQSKEASAEEKTPENVLHENQQPGHKTELHDNPVLKSALHDHGSIDHNDEGHGVLGDSIPRNVKSNHQRCTNCCGRLQVRESKREEEQYELEHINESCSASEEGHSHGCRCDDNKKDEIHKRKTNTGSDSCDAVGNPEPPSSPSQPKSNFNELENEMRLRGGCGGGCGGGGGSRNSACCPCGGCGGAACATNTSSCDNTLPLGCCGGNQSRGLPCRCKCRSCSNPCPPCGTCGGQNCGKWNSCAGSGGGKCCFPRNTKRRNGPNCCGGSSGGCGGCC